MTNLFVIVVCYNGQKWIRKCLDSLKNSSIEVQVIILDNSSEDQTTTIIHEEYPAYHLISLNENLGFGKANNLGIKKAIELGADYVFLLNQDAWVGTNTIEKLVAIHNSNDNYGIISPFHLNGNGDLIDHLFFKNLMNHTSARKLFSDLTTKQNKNKIYDITFVNAAAWLLSKKCIEEIGLFDPLFQHYGEDNNYCHRVSYHQLKIGVVTDCFIYHDREDRLNKKPGWQDNIPLSLNLKLANVLNENFENSYQEEIKKILIEITKGILKLKYDKISINFKKLKYIFFNKMIIKKSYEINKIKP